MLARLDRSVTTSARRLLGLPLTAPNEAACHEAGLLSATAFDARAKLLFYAKLVRQAEAGDRHPAYDVFAARRCDATGRKGLLSCNWVHEVWKLCDKYKLNRRDFDNDVGRARSKWRASVNAMTRAVVTNDRRLVLWPEADRSGVLAAVRATAARPGLPPARREKLSGSLSGQLHVRFGLASYLRNSESDDLIRELGSLLAARRSGADFLNSGHHKFQAGHDERCPLCVARQRAAPGGAGPVPIETVEHFLLSCPVLEPKRQEVLADLGPEHRARVQTVLAAIRGRRGDAVEAEVGLIVNAGQHLNLVANFLGD